ncbi:MAG: 2Fe-2S iron-sulfur cluster binding domain-containing protein, partial [Roseibium sp.]|uniref:2Fe-2S iron-sulfur cluster binding domain-containing protein n=1 Tax=Roseibium sp. TaxID=1936156 RepID=UPI00261E2952
GECGSCKCRLDEGKVKDLGSVPGTLSPEEIADGWILPCRTIAKTDVHLSVPGVLGAPPPVLQKLEGEIIDLQKVAPDIIRLWIEPPAPFLFHAGQFVELQFHGQPKRSYSPANKPGAAVLEFFVKIVPDGFVSTYLAGEAKPGSKVRIEGPFGTASLSAPPDRPVLFAAGGTGLAPCLSMIRYLANTSPDTACVLYAGACKACDLFAEDALESVQWMMPGLKVVNVLSGETDPRYETGFIAPNIQKSHETLAGWTAFIAGPPPMVESVRKTVLNMGIDAGDTYSDPFTAAVPPSALTRAVNSLRRFASAGSMRG